MSVVNKTENPLKKENVKDVPKEWHPQQSKLLKNWAEVASSYRWMHNQAHMIYKKKNLRFMIPLIIMSTVAGTANFAQETFPISIKPYVPQIIGAINLISAIMTTIYQFLKISEFMESHRISSINYGKLARTITVELSLPVKDRNSGGAECVKVSRTEIDRLIEQSPSIPKSVLTNYQQNFSGNGLSEPEIIVINKVDVYEDIENKTATTVAEAGAKLKSMLFKKPVHLIKNTSSPTTRKNEEIKTEMNSLSGKFGSVVSQLRDKMSGISPKKEKEIVIPQFEPEENVITQPIVIDPKKPETTPPKIVIINEEESYEPSKPLEPLLSISENLFKNKLIKTDKSDTESEISEVSETTEIVNDVVETLINETVQHTGGISDELEALRSSKRVTGKKG
jgi:hypothetical protein